MNPIIEAEMEHFGTNIEEPDDLHSFDKDYWAFVMADEDGTFSLDEDLFDQDEEDQNQLLVEEPETPSLPVLDEDNPESYARSKFYFADITFPVSLLPYEDTEEYLDDINPYGPFFRLSTSKQFDPDINWITPVYSEELVSRVITNLKQVYSPYVMKIISAYEDIKDLRQYLLTLVNLAGFRDHYAEPWMELLIPTISNAWKLLPPSQMRIASKLKALFELENDPFNIEELWKRKFQTVPSLEISKIVKKDVMHYGYPLVEMAINISAGTRLNVGANGYLKIYRRWLYLANLRDWNKMSKTMPKLGLGHIELPWGIPEPTAELIIRYHNIKYGQPLNFTEMEKLNYLVGLTSNESLTHSMSKMSMNEFSMERFVSYHFSSKSPDNYSAYLSKFEKVPLYCKTCKQPIHELEINYSKRNMYDECYKCLITLATHDYSENWSDIEMRYGVKIYDHHEYMCDYCANCGTHYVYRFEGIPEYEDSEDLDSESSMEDFRDNINYEYEDDYEWFDNLPEVNAELSDEDCEDYLGEEY